MSTESVQGDSLEKIAGEVRVCTLCALSKARTNAVPGEGSGKADLMLIGEGPGYNEDKQGRPFVGAAGGFLDHMLASAGMNRGDVFITNIVKCRPPQNRDPLPEEVEACSGYLQRQIALIQPAVIATLGRHSMARYFPAERISRVHGQPRRVGDQTVVPLFHPAAALHQSSLKAAEIEDFSRLPGVVEVARQHRQCAPPAPDAGQTGEQRERSPDQLRLFEMSDEMSDE